MPALQQPTWGMKKRALSGAEAEDADVSKSAKGLGKPARSRKAGAGDGDDLDCDLKALIIAIAHVCYFIFSHQCARYLYAWVALGKAATDRRQLTRRD